MEERDDEDGGCEQEGQVDAGHAVRDRDARAVAERGQAETERQQNR